MKYQPHSSGEFEVLREDLKESNIVFIHGKLDDAGLSVSAFRIYCHIARRGHCHSKAKTVSEVCRLELKTVWKALKELQSRNMIARQSRLGHTTVITLTKPSVWTPDPLSPPPTQPVKPPRGYSVKPPTPLTRLAPHEVYPLKVDPIKGEKGPLVSAAPLGNGKPSATEMILRERELKRVEARIGSLRASYCDHQDWDAKDRDELKILKARRKELLAVLAFSV